LAEPTGDKTEEPTPHKLQEARKKGQVAKSKELTTAVLVIVSYKVFAAYAQQIWVRLVEFGAFCFSQIENVQYLMDPAYANSLVLHTIITFFMAMLPIFITTFTVAILIEAIQTRFVFSPSSMEPKLDKLNPMNGIKRIFSLKGLVQIVLSLAKIIIVVMITWSVIKNELQQIINSLTMDLWAIMFFVGKLVMTIAGKVGLFYLIIALLDYLYQKHEFHKSMMMTKQEVKEEYKRLEGDPVIKQAQKQKQREMSQKRQQGAVPGADVVVTNPVHIACALRYDPDVDRSPMLLAKGRRLNAEEIKRIAEEHNVPIVENEELARELFATTEIGSEIPPDLYRAVAEVLAFVYKLGRNRQRVNKYKTVVNRS